MTQVAGVGVRPDAPLGMQYTGYVPQFPGNTYTSFG